MKEPTPGVIRVARKRAGLQGWRDAATLPVPFLVRGEAPYRIIQTPPRSGETLGGAERILTMPYPEKLFALVEQLYLRVHPSEPY